MSEQSSEYTAPHVRVKVERNSKAYNWEATVLVAGEDVSRALELLKQAEEALRKEYGTQLP
jgi:hypothetical protein